MATVKKLNKDIEMTQTSQNSLQSPPDQLQRKLSNRHLQLIAIGGAIGTGLFMGSGKTISLADYWSDVFLSNARFGRNFIIQSALQIFY